MGRKAPGAFESCLIMSSCATDGSDHRKTIRKGKTLIIRPHQFDRPIADHRKTFVKETL